MPPCPLHSPRRPPIALSTHSRQWRPSPPAATPQNEPPNAAPASPPAPDAHPPPPPPAVAVTFLPSATVPDAVTTSAAPGTNLMEVGSSVGIDLPGGCFSGSCGLCEVEVSTRDSNGALLADRLVQRACIAVVPTDVASMTIAELADDAVWGQDGWDT